MTPEQLAERVSVLESRLDYLEDKLSRLVETPSPAPESSADEDRIMALSARWPDSSADLDEFVRQACDDLASSVNQSGTTDQIRWLIANTDWTLDQLELTLDDGKED